MKRPRTLPWRQSTIQLRTHTTTRSSEDTPLDADVIVVGGGPAGLAAATELASLGVPRVLLLERESVAGGVPRHCGHYAFGLRETHRLLRGPAYAKRLVQRAQDCQVALRAGVSVKALHPGPRLTISSDAGIQTLQARHVLLCTGVRESTRVQRLIGGTKPGGVLSTGALQAMVYLKDHCPFKRPVILGTELVSFSAILTCRHSGIRPVAMVEPGTRPVARWPAAWFPKLLGIPLMLDTQVLAVEGHDQVEKVIVQSANGLTHELEADGLIVSGQFRPESSIIQVSHLKLDAGTGGPQVDQYGRCSDPDYFAAGNLLRPAETAGWSWAEGRAVARAMYSSLQGNMTMQQDRYQLTLGSDALRYVMPQRVAQATQKEDKPALPAFQIRVNRPVSGHIDFLHKGVCIATHAIKALPERRISIDLNRIPVDIQGEVELVIRES